MKKEDFKRSNLLPIFVLAILLMIIYNALNSLGKITSAIGGFLIVISPLLYGVLFAYFLYIPHQAMEKLIKKVKIAFISKHARGVTTVLIFLILLVLVSFILSVVLPVVFTSIVDLANSIPGYLSTILKFFDDLPEDSILVEFDVAGTIKNSSGDMLGTIVNPSGIEQVARGIVSFAGEIFKLIMGLVISLYLLMDRARISEFFKRLNNAVFKREVRRNRMIKYLSQINKVLFTFIASKGLDSIINLVVATVLLLVFKIPYALLLGLIAGLFNFIPYLGSIISAIIISIIALITTDLTTSIPVMIGLLIFNQLDGNYIEPRIMKSSLKISPVLVIIAVVIGGAYFGIIGMFLAVPVAVILKQLLNEYIASTEIEKVSVDVPDEAQGDVALGVVVSEVMDEVVDVSDNVDGDAAGSDN